MNTVESAAATPGEDAGRAIVPYPTNDLTKAPVYYDVDANKLALIKAQVAPGCNDIEVSHFLELCHHYGLDAFAKEAWCAKGRNGLLIMVGRDGLRKIVQRQGLLMDGDVVRERDTFTVERGPNRSRTIQHAYGEARREDQARRGDATTPEGSSRGPIIGAWAEVYTKAGRQLGYFYAPLSEYRPPNPDPRSVWAKQESVMILAAAERQAARQATPLGGLLVEGEDEIVLARQGGTLDAGQGDGKPQGCALGDEIEAVLARAAKIGVAVDRGMVEMEVCDADGRVIAERAAQWVKTNMAALDAIPPEAEVVDAQEAPPSAVASPAPKRPSEPDASRERPAQHGEADRYAPPTDDEQSAADALGVPIVSQGFLDEGPPRKATPAPDDRAEALAVLRRRGDQLLSAAQAAEEAGHTEEADSHYAELAAVEANIEAMSNTDQGTLI